MTDTKRFARMTPAEYGRMLAEQEPLITDEQAEAAARVLANVLRDSRVSETDR